MLPSCSSALLLNFCEAFRSASHILKTSSSQAAHTASFYQATRLRHRDQSRQVSRWCYVHRFSWTHCHTNRHHSTSVQVRVHHAVPEATFPNEIPGINWDDKLLQPLHRTLLPLATTTVRNAQAI